MNECNYCINKEACSSCDITWHDKFIPNDDVRKYFIWGYNGVRGINGHTWYFDTTNKDLVQTHTIRIHNSIYCPYCGERMLPIQDATTLDTIGLCCICEGARAELEYERELEELKEAYEMDYAHLMDRYSEKLAFNTDKLLSIKHKIELERPHRKLNHFSTLNGKEIHDIDDM